MGWRYFTVIRPIVSLIERAKRNPTWLLGILLAAHLLLISFNKAPGKPDLWIFQASFLAITSPIQSVLSHSAAWVKNGWSNYFSLRDSRMENENLRQERTRFETQMLDLREKVKQLELSKSQTDWQSTSSYRAIQARVVGRDANKLFSTVVIDKGSNDGIQKNMPVIASGGLVGRVIITSPFSSRVMLLTDERHGAGAVIAQTAENRLLGIVKGKDNFVCELKFIAPPDKVDNGEQVMTSGQDGIYPKGLLIGRIRKPDNVTSVTPSVVEVDPSAPIGSLEIVSVILIPTDQLRKAITELAEEEKKLEPAKPAKSTKSARSAN